MSGTTVRALCGCLLAAGIVASVLRAGDTASSLPAAAQRSVDFKKDIYPILSKRCFSCHQGVGASSGHRLDLRAELVGESNGRPLVYVGDSGKSKLIQMVAGLVPNKVMPARGERLSAEQVGLLRAWIDQGLKWDDRLLPPLTAEVRHWSFQPVKRPALPTIRNSAWVRTPVDRFIAAPHEARGVTPAAEASRQVLVRRLALDLTGLPPTPEEVEAALNDKSPQWYEKLVERLLASPHYGERWGRHWLDLARWADTEGYESDHLRPYAWRYRDYVVKSFNDDKPYDRFLREQIAGDELEPYADEHLVATGFLASARLSSNEEDKARQRNDVLVDIVNATASTVLGLTMNCAQCHSHKFDPISARDYYRFQGFFVKGMPNNLALKDPEGWRLYEAAKPSEYEPAQKLKQTIYESVRGRLGTEARKKLSSDQLMALDTPEDRRTPEQQKLAREADLKFQFTNGQVERAIPDEDKKLYEELKKKIETLEKRMPDKPQTFGFYSPVTSPNAVAVLPMKGFYPPPYDPQELARAKSHLLVQGDVQRRGADVDVGWPEVFGAVPRVAVARRPRSTLVDWLVSADHPLTARVWVNRVWQYHFGRGLVATSSDFGVRGAPPTHPDLLDWLAAELMNPADGPKWSTKHLHRLMVLSATYRQAAASNDRNKEIDPDNLTWWRWTPRRLEVEAIRDSLLAVSGELDRKLGGPSLADENKSVRRGLYLLQRRQRGPMVQELFDGPTAAAESCPKRNVSTVPLQALYLLNNEFALGRAKALAQRVVEQSGGERARQIDVAFRQTLGRTPDEVERSAALKFFATSSATGPETAPPVALVHFCQALLNLNEFLYLE